MRWTWPSPVEAAADRCDAERSSVETERRALFFSGDTGWHEALPERVGDVDQLISECVFFDDDRFEYHLSHDQLDRMRERFRCSATILTHLGKDLIDNLEDDFPGRQYTEGDIYALINDRFCYGVKWVFRSPCRYILQKYMDELIELVMVEATEREVCEQLRFCW